MTLLRRPRVPEPLLSARDLLDAAAAESLPPLREADPASEAIVSWASQYLAWDAGSD